jgi:hypothetical protein
MDPIMTRSQGNDERNITTNAISAYSAALQPACFQTPVYSLNATPKELTMPTLVGPFSDTHTKTLPVLSDDGSLGWVADHMQQLLKEHLNKWILVKGGEIVEIADSSTELERHAIERGLVNGLIIKLEEPSAAWRTAYLAHVG